MEGLLILTEKHSAMIINQWNTNENDYKEIIEGHKNCKGDLIFYWIPYGKKIELNY